MGSMVSYYEEVSFTPEPNISLFDNDTKIYPRRFHHLHLSMSNPHRAGGLSRVGYDPN